MIDERTIETELAKPLLVENIKEREGAGKSKFYYIEAHHAIREANTIFGHLGWSRETLSCDLVCTTPYQSWNKFKKKEESKVAVSYVARVAVTVMTENGPVVRHGTGYGDGQAAADRAYTAHELAAKEAESDAMKRALSTFGDRFGLALYEKDKSKANVTFDRDESAPPAPVQPQSKANSRDTFSAMVEDLRKTESVVQLDQWLKEPNTKSGFKSLADDWKHNFGEEVTEHRKALIANAEMDRLARVS